MSTIVRPTTCASRLGHCSNSQPVPLLLEPVAAAPPQRREPEREGDRPGGERRHRPEQDALADAADVERVRDPWCEEDEHDEHAQLGQRHGDEVPAQEPVEMRRAMEDRVAPVAVRIDVREVQVVRHCRLPEEVRGHEPRRRGEH